MPASASASTPQGGKGGGRGGRGRGGRGGRGRAGGGKVNFPPQKRLDPYDRELDNDHIYNVLKQHNHIYSSDDTVACASNNPFRMFHPFHCSHNPIGDQIKKKGDECDFMWIKFIQFKLGYQSVATCIETNNGNYVGLFMDTQTDNVYYFDPTGDDYSKHYQISKYLDILKENYKDDYGGVLHIHQNTFCHLNKSKTLSGIYCIHFIQEMMIAKKQADKKKTNVSVHYLKYFGNKIPEKKMVDFRTKLCEDKKIEF